MPEILDLFGVPICLPRGRGRPPHVPTPEKRKQFAQLRRRRVPVSEIARALGVTEPTLRLHYFSRRTKRNQRPPGGSKSL
jgi:transposase-like protein